MQGLVQISVFLMALLGYARTHNGILIYSATPAEGFQTNQSKTVRSIDTMSFVNHVNAQNISGLKIHLLVFRSVANTAT